MRQQQQQQGTPPKGRSTKRGFQRQLNGLIAAGEECERQRGVRLDEARRLCRAARATLREFLDPKCRWVPPELVRYRLRAFRRALRRAGALGGGNTQSTAEASFREQMDAAFKRAQQEGLVV